jgi:hypothetical protein
VLLRTTDTKVYFKEKLNTIKTRMWFAFTTFLFLHLSSSLAQYNSEKHFEKSHLLTQQRNSNLFYGVAPNSFNIYWPENPNI